MKYVCHVSEDPSADTDWKPGSKMKRKNIYFKQKVRQSWITNTQRILKNKTQELTKTRNKKLTRKPKPSSNGNTGGQPEEYKGSDKCCETSRRLNNVGGVIGE